MKRLIAVVAVVMLGWGTTMQAQAGSWSIKTTISAIEISNGAAPGVWLNFQNQPYKSPVCTSKNGQYFLGGGAANVTQMTSLATTAMIHKRDVTIFWNGSCVGGYPVVTGLTMK